MEIYKRKGVSILQYDSPGRRVWRIVSPILVYFGITMLISFISSFIVSYQVMSTTTAADVNELMEEIMMRSMEISVPVTLISGLAALPFLWRMMKKDRRLRKFTGNMATLKKGRLIYCAAAGILACVAGSILVTITQIGQVFEGYGDVSETIFSQSFVLQLIAAGIIAPFVEELVFRGLIYNRLKDYTTIHVAMLASSVIFGLYHGNLIQGVYGFVMGLLMCFVYEKYHTMAAPLICHGAANLISIVLQLLQVTIDSIVVAGAIALVCIGLLYLVLKQIQKSVNVELMPNKDFIDVTIGMESGSGVTPSRPSSNWPYSSGNNNGSNQPHPDPGDPADEGNGQNGARKYTVDDYYPKNNSDDDE